MQPHDTPEISSSRFHLQSVSTSTRNAIGDIGCQRCQHCTLRRWWAHTSITATTSIVNQEVPSVRLEDTRSQLCKER